MASRVLSSIAALSAVATATACSADEPIFHGNGFVAVGQDARGRIGHAGGNPYAGEIVAAREYSPDGYARTVIIVSGVGRSIGVPDDRLAIRAVVAEINCNNRTTRAGEFAGFDFQGNMVEQPFRLTHPSQDFTHTVSDQELVQLVCERREAVEAPEFISLRDFSEQVARSMPPPNPNVRGPMVSVGRD